MENWTTTEKALFAKQWPIHLDSHRRGIPCAVCLEERWDFAGTIRDGRLLVCMDCYKTRTDLPEMYGPIS